MRVKKKHNPRIISLIALLLAVFCIFGFRAADFQVVTANEYASQNANLKAVTATVKATRGVIVDRCGRTIAVNREGYDVVFNNAYLKKSNFNDYILKLILLFNMYGETWNDILPITQEEPYEFTDDTVSVDALKSRLGLNSYATSENCIKEMVSRYSAESVPAKYQRAVIGVRYSMEKSDFSVANPYTFASDISTDLMMDIAESYPDMYGVEINISTYREYTDPTLAPNIVGTVGKIYAEQWDELKEKGYSYNDIVGKDGVEAAFEEYLRGVDGKVTYYFDTNGNVVYTETVREPKQGDTIFLSIDSKLQKVTQNALTKNIKKLNSSGGNITGGAVVITKVRTGEVLASANYPSYSLDDYYNNFSSLSTAEGNPLFDRAFKGLYPPGSAFKPLVAAAGLQEGIIDRNFTIFCSQKYTYYEDYQPSCMHYHKYVNVISALSQSCNYFFFDTGRRLGITKLNNYSRNFGLGVKTGVETSEYAGILAGPDYTRSIGQNWYDGMTLSAAIGQSFNLFTPLQLSVFTGTVANGGTRYRATLLNSIRDASTNEYLYNITPETVCDTGVSESVISIVKEGMHSVTQEGTARAYFADYPVSVGGKTGTAQTSGLDNSVLIIFAPYDNPEIAISIVIEHGERSVSTGPIAQDILNEYFFSEVDEFEYPPYEKLL